MIQFRQKVFTEYDAMKSLYEDLMRRPDRYKYGKIDSRSLIPILKGNNIVIERFVISTSLFGKDKYRMYLKIGAKAKMPDAVRLPGRNTTKKLLGLQLNLGEGGNNDKKKNKNNNNNNNNKNNNNQQQKQYGNTNENNRIRLFSMRVENFRIPIDISKEVTELTGETLMYDKQSRTIVLEFSSINDAINALNILPFGLNYKVYLLDV